MKFVLTCLSLGILVLVAACSEADRDWFQGVKHLDCPVDDYVDGDAVQNLTSDAVVLSSCSPDYPIGNPTQTIPANSPITDFSIKVGSHTQKTEVMAGDNCDEAEVPAGDSVGHRFRMLTPADAEHYVLCYNPANVEPDYPNVSLPLYSIVRRQSPCPSSAQPFDQTAIACK